MAAGSLPSPKELDNLSKEICDCWQSLGIQLGVGMARIDCIVNDNVQSPGPEKKAFAMLKSWYDKGSGSTYCVLSEALKKVDKARLAEKYCEAIKSKDDSEDMSTPETDTSHGIEPRLPGAEAEIQERADVCQEQIHSKAVLEYFCKTCQKCICQKCTVGIHKSHDFEYIKEAAMKAKTRLQETENKIQEADDAFKKQTNKDIDTRREFKNQIKETRQAIQENSQRLVEMLKRHEQQLLTEVDAFEEDAEKTFEDQTKNSKLRRELLNSITEQLRGVRLQADIDVLKSEQSVMSQTQEVFDALASYQPLKIVYVEYTPDEYVSRRLDNSPLGQVGSGLADPQKTQIQELTNKRIEKERRAQFTVVTKDTEDNICYSASEHVFVKILSPAGDEVETEVEDRKDGTYTVCFTPNTEGVHHVTVRVRGQSPANSPFRVHVSKRRPCEYRAVATFGSHGSGKGQLKHPAGIAVNRSRELVAVSDSINNRVQIFTADGLYWREFGTKGTANGKFDHPLGLAYVKTTVGVSHESHTQSYTQRLSSLSGLLFS